MDLIKYLLKPSTTFIDRDLLILLLIGSSFFLIGVIAAAIISGRSLLQVMKQNSKTVMVLLLLSIAIPVTAGSALRPTSYVSQASTQVVIENIKVEKTSTTSAEVSFTTNPAASVYLEYKDNNQEGYIPVVPTKDPTSKRTEHNFIIENISEQGGEIVFIVNGRQLLINNQAYPIK